MSVRIDKSRQNYFACAIDLNKLPAVFLHPGIAECISRLAERNDLSAKANHRSIPDDSKFAQILATPWARTTALQSNQLPYIRQKSGLIKWGGHSWRRLSGICLSAQNWNLQ
jgi:hypothetical protein